MDFCGPLWFAVDWCGLVGIAVDCCGLLWTVVDCPPPCPAMGLHGKLLGLLGSLILSQVPYTEPMPVEGTGLGGKVRQINKTYFTNF